MIIKFIENKYNSTVSLDGTYTCGNKDLRA